MGISPARLVAFDLLLELRQKPQLHSDQLLRSKRVSSLSSADRNLSTALVMGVLRWQIALDERIATALTDAKAHLDAPVEVALELGALQLWLFDRIPAHAAIFESVELAKQSGNSRAAGLINAVLRKLQKLPKAQPASARSASPGEIASAWAHPEWMVARWVRDYGVEAAAAICRFDQYPPPTTVRLLAPEAEAALKEEGLRLEPGAFVEQARRVVQGDIARSQTLARGLVRIQDEGSQLIAELASRGNRTPASILDCCAAPGGKTAILAERNPQVPITACEIHPGRLKSMQSFLRMQADRITFRAIDATRLDCESQFDLVLCDVPCSGTGTLARNPEIRHRITSGDLLRQQERQIKLLTSAMRCLAEGGQLVYSTCSLEAEENEGVVQQVLAGQKGFRLLSGRDRMRALESQGVLRAGSTNLIFPPGSRENFLRTLPGIHPCDGFFGAFLTRKA